MLAVLSPAKSLNTDLIPGLPAATVPVFLEQSQRLAEHMRSYSPADLADLMKLSDKLAALNAARFEQWDSNHASDDLLPAAFAFNGDVYQGLDVTSLSAAALGRLNDRIRILSGLYGVLRPSDAMRPYRLEMGTRFKTGPITSLPNYWKETVTSHLNQTLDGRPLLNLASQEYAQAVDLKAIEGGVITPVFKDLKNGEYKIISFYAKRARGLMARFLLEQEVDARADLHAFDYQGYVYSKAHSTPEAPCFLRDPSAS